MFSVKKKDKHTNERVTHRLTCDIFYFPKEKKIIDSYFQHIDIIFKSKEINSIRYITC